MTLTEQGGEFPQTTTEPGLINLALGQPSPSFLPVELIGQAAREAFDADTDPLVLQYGVIPGYAGFRQALAAMLEGVSAAPVEPEHLFVTGGISTALSLVADVFGGAGKTAVCGDPTYFLARGVFETAGMRVLGVPVDDQGLRVAELERMLRTGQVRPALVYCMPSFHNPCGVVLSSERCERLVDLAERHDFVVAADEPYIMLHFGEEAPSSLMAYDRGRGRVLSLGSFSKILAPGLRLGWIHAEPVLLERLASHGALRSGGGLNPAMSAIVHRTLANGSLLRHIARLRSTCATRCSALASALRTKLPACRFNEPRGGYFVWLDLGEGRSATGLLEVGQAHGVTFAPGPRCAIERDLDRYARLCFAFYEADELREGVERLAAAYDASA